MVNAQPTITQRPSKLAHPCPAPRPGSILLHPDVKGNYDWLVEYRAKGRPSQWAATYAWEMASAHTMFLELIMRTYSFAHYAVEHDDLENYLGFADVAFAQIWHHHHFEEDLLFPHIKKYLSASEQDPMQANINQHDMFAPQLEAAWRYVRACRKALNPKVPTPVADPSEEHKPALNAVAEATADAPLSSDNPSDHVDGNRLTRVDLSALGTVFDPDSLQRQMEEWMPHLCIHLKEEIDTIGAEVVDGWGKKCFDEGYAITQKHLKAMDPSWFLCSVVAVLPMANVKSLMRLPIFVRRGLVPFMFASKYWDWWLYCNHPENLTWKGSA
ncbi:hypothetical protein IAU60_004684 [Kwoniella sp. DSM 27419]